MKYKIQNIGGAFMVTIPLEIIKELGWEKGHKVNIYHDKENNSLRISDFRAYMRFKEELLREKRHREGCHDSLSCLYDHS